jgi:ATP-binding cassette, subfamily F, member 3
VSLVVFEKVSLGFGKKTIVSDLDLRIGEGDRIGLIGPNGSGKSTLLKLLSGEAKPDSGRITTARGLEIGWLPQDIALTGGRSLIEFVLSSVPGRESLDATIVSTEAELAAVQAAVESGQRPIDDPELMDLAIRVAELHERLTHFETHYSEHEAYKILAGLGFAAGDYTRDLGEFSGGWKMRAVLASLLFQRPDLMLLDEPTNHLDMPSVAWFGEFLQRYRRSFILICHDREFLDEQIDRVVSFESEGVRQYRGNYLAYRKQREEEEIVLENKARNLERERAKTEQFIDRFRAQANKAKAVQSRVKALEKMDDVVVFEKRRVMRFNFPPTGRTGHEVIKIRGLKKAYASVEPGKPDHVVFPSLDLTVTRGEKIGIIGINGAGKTTLLRMIAGEIPYDSGALELGHKVQPGYYAQHHAESLHRELTVFDEVAQQDPEAGQTRVRTILGAFLYSGDDVDKKISVLSGGERARVALAKLLIKPGNLLLMDEPTNHLDLESSESLAESLTTYDGTVLFVSHNRSFIRTLATKIWNVHDGIVEIYPGTLDEYLASARDRGDALEAVADGKAGPTKQPKSNAAEPAPVSAVAAPSVAGPAPRDREAERERKRIEAEQRNRRSKQLKPLQRKVAELEGRIAELEEAQQKRSVELADPAVYQDEARRSKLLDAYQDAAAKLEDLSGRWELATLELEELSADLD